MAATPIDPIKLHNFELPKFWGDDASSSSTVNRRSRFYKPPAASSAPPPLPPQSPLIRRDSSKSLPVEKVLRRKSKGGQNSKTSTNFSNPPTNMNFEVEKSHQQSHKYNPTPPPPPPLEINDEDPRLCQLRPPRRRRLIKKSSANKTRVFNSRGEEGGENIKSRVSKPLESNDKLAVGMPISAKDKEMGGSCGEIRKDKEKKEIDNEEKDENKGKGEILMEEDLKEEVVVVKGGGGEKKKQLSITIPLTKHEIEEDIFALTGANPSKRPFKKYTKNVQMNLNAKFPGLCLSSITPDTYKVARPSRKKRKHY